MLELITMSILGACYIKALADETIEEQKEKEEERIRDLKIKVFCYAVSRKMLYSDVVTKLQNKEISFEDVIKE